MRTLLATTLAAAIALAGLTTPAGAQAPAITRYRGTVEQISPTTATLKTRDGKSIAISLDGTKAVSVAKSDLSEIKPDSYIGTASAPGPNGTLKALEVHVFDPSMRGTGDGSYPWDSPGSTTMTNGAVGALVGTSGRTMTVQYKGGEKQIVVPDDVPVVHMAPGDLAQVKPGSHIIAFTTKGDGDALKTVFLVYGQDGLVPPM